CISDTCPICLPLGHYSQKVLSVQCLPSQQLRAKHGQTTPGSTVPGLARVRFEWLLVRRQGIQPVDPTGFSAQEGKVSVTPPGQGWLMVNRHALKGWYKDPTADIMGLPGGADWDLWILAGVGNSKGDVKAKIKSNTNLYTVAYCSTGLHGWELPKQLNWKTVQNIHRMNMASTCNPVTLPLPNYSKRANGCHCNVCGKLNYRCDYLSMLKNVLGCSLEFCFSFGKGKPLKYCAFVVCYTNKNRYLPLALLLASLQ
ncbi:hypothetical protein XELAEV_18042257mg, partial [Xenopus laevis]